MFRILRQRNNNSASGLGRVALREATNAMSARVIYPTCEQYDGSMYEEAMPRYRKVQS